MSAMEKLKTVKFYLLYNGKESLFKKSEGLGASNSEIAAGFAGYINTVYSNLKKDKSYYYPTMNPFMEPKEFKIMREMGQNWKLEKETKKIDGYLCYKATTTDQYKRHGKIHQYEITAWYCPEIPIPSGPLGYGKLPGLILELQNRFAVIGVSEIQLNLKKKIKMPSFEDGKALSKKDYYAIFHKRMKFAKEN